jgi:hypothetical protein
LRRQLKDILQIENESHAGSAKIFAAVCGEVNAPLPPDAVLRERLEKTLRELLTVPVKTPSGTRRFPLGTAVVCYQRGELTLGFQPFLTDARAAIAYGLALLLDTERGLAEGLMQCQGVSEEKECELFFWRSSRAQRYCTPEHAKEACKQKTKRRVETWRGNHPDWYERDRVRRQRKAMEGARARKKK